MSDNTFTGLRPVSKRIEVNDLNRKTKCIVLPPREPRIATPVAVPVPTIVPKPIPPQAALEPPRDIPAPKPAPVAQKRFTLIPVAPALVELIPNGITLTEQWTFIGSNPTMQIPAFTALILHLDGISRVHAAVMAFHDKAFVADLGSTNGTRIFRDQKAVEVTAEPTQLHPGDVLWMGAVFFHVMEN